MICRQLCQGTIEDGNDPVLGVIQLIHLFRLASL
jgi:hypothetical protein